MIDIKELRDRLVNDLDCRDSQADDIVKKINSLAPDIYSAFETWFRTGTVSEIEVEGYTVSSLRRLKKNLNIVGAYLTLDWLRRDPVHAKAALSQKEFVNSAVTRKS
jgi:hypothetical protein